MYRGTPGFRGTQFDDHCCGVYTFLVGENSGIVHLMFNVARQGNTRAIDPKPRNFEPRDEAHFWLNGYVNKQNCRIWSEANPQVYVETPLHPEKLTVWCALWASGILLQKR
ncbi:hypothetical protein TNCV_457861 [Trichonephila clavipes]|nr:hypothetical protein TNCV_457861 [Trichonephila clavipes]